MVKKAQDEREELVHATQKVTEKKGSGLDSSVTGCLTVPAGIGRLDALGYATTR